MLDAQQCVTMACLLDVIAPKPGNVHRGADFEDMTFLDFAASAVAIAPHIANANQQRLGKTVLDSIQATRCVVSTNTNLGIVLCLAPLSAVRDADDKQAALASLFERLTEEDANNFFEAIRLADASGLGDVDELDVNATEIGPADLMHAMELAKDRDRIAELYVTKFSLVFEKVVPTLLQKCETLGLLAGIVATFVELLSTYPDTLILRKCGPKVAMEASVRARKVVDGAPDDVHKLLSELDFWLRSDNHRRNPGTTADIVTAGVFLGLLDDRLRLGRDFQDRR